MKWSAWIIAAVLAAGCATTQSAAGRTDEPRPVTGAGTSTVPCLVDPSQPVATQMSRCAAMEIDPEVMRAVNDKRLHIVAMGDRVRVSVPTDIRFPEGKFTLNSDQQYAIHQVATVLSQIKDPLVVVEGYSDTTPRAAGRKSRNRMGSTNLGLGAERAHSVVKVLLNAGIPESRLRLHSYGTAQPLRDNMSAEGRAANRRITIALMNPKDETNSGWLNPDGSPRTPEIANIPSDWVTPSSVAAPTTTATDWETIVPVPAAPPPAEPAPEPVFTPITDDGWITVTEAGNQPAPQPAPAPVGNDGWFTPPAQAPASNDGWMTAPPAAPVANDGWVTVPVAPAGGDDWVTVDVAPAAPARQAAPAPAPATPDKKEKKVVDDGWITVPAAPASSSDGDAEWITVP